jgi:hypothetical protein
MNISDDPATCVAYPVTVIDNFFDNPDAIVDLAEKSDWYDTVDGNWPGKRTNSLWDIDQEIYKKFGNRIHRIYHDIPPEYWELQAHFQKIEPFPNDKRNQGWIHTDGTWFGGIIYLTKDPSPNSGTSIYNAHKVSSYKVTKNYKEMLYRGEDVDIDDYNEAWDAMREQYTKTVTVENIYNRFVLFSGQTFHGVETFGTKPRLTMNFFGRNSTSTPPLLR